MKSIRLVGLFVAVLALCIFAIPSNASIDFSKSVCYYAGVWNDAVNAYVLTWSDKQHVRHGYQQFNWDARLVIYDLDGGALCHGDRVVLQGVGMPFIRHGNVGDIVTLADQAQTDDNSLIWRIAIWGGAPLGTPINPYTDRVHFNGPGGPGTVYLTTTGGPNVNGDLAYLDHGGGPEATFRLRHFAPADAPNFYHYGWNEGLDAGQFKPQSRVVAHNGKFVIIRYNQSSGRFVYRVLDPTVTQARSTTSPALTGAAELPLPPEVDFHPSFQAVSDGNFIFFWSINRNDRSLCVTKLVLDNKNAISRAWGLRQIQNQDSTVSWSFMNDNGMDPVLMPCVSVPAAARVDMGATPFSVLLLPSNHGNYERWAIFYALPGQSQLHYLSLLKEKDDWRPWVENEDQIVLNPASPADSVVIRGFIHKTIDLGSVFNHSSPGQRGVTALAYAAHVKNTSGRYVKTGVRVLLASLDAGGANLGLASLRLMGDGTVLANSAASANIVDDQDPVSLDANSVATLDCAGFPPAGPPSLFESGDGFVYLNYLSSVSGVTKPVMLIWNPETHRIERAASGFGAHPDHHYEFQRDGFWAYRSYAYERDALQVPPNHLAEPEYFEFAGMDTSGGQISAKLMRAQLIVPSDNRLLIESDYKVGDLARQYIGNLITDPSLVGYIEGAPPVHAANLADAAELSGKIGMRYTNRLARNNTYSTNSDFGFGASVKGLAGTFKFSVESNRSFLWEWARSEELENDFSVSQTLTGDMISNRFVPDNLGTALISGTEAKLYGFYLTNQQEPRLVSYFTEPTGITSQSLVVFQIDPNYIRNGDIRSYVKEDYYSLMSTISAEEAAREAFFKQFDAQGQTSAMNITPAWYRDRRFLHNYYVMTRPSFDAHEQKLNLTTINTVGGVIDQKVKLGYSAEVTVLGQKIAEFEALGNIHFNFVVKKSQEEMETLLLALEPSNFDQVPFFAARPSPAQARQYTFHTFLLEPDYRNFDAFFSRVVDRTWMNMHKDGAARALWAIQSRNNKNRCWRVLHRVTENQWGDY